MAAPNQALPSDSEDRMLLAIQAINRGHCGSVRAAAGMYHVSRTTLTQRMRGSPSLRSDSTSDSQRSILQLSDSSAESERTILDEEHALSQEDHALDQEDYALGRCLLDLSSHGVHPRPQAVEGTDRNAGPGNQNETLETPQNATEPEHQTTHLEECVGRHQESSPTSIHEALDHLVKGVQKTIDSATLLKAEVQALREESQFRKPREGKRKREISEDRELVDRGQFQAGQVGEGSERQDPKRPYQCNKCKRHGHNSRTCKETSDFGSN